MKLKSKLTALVFSAALGLISAPLASVARADDSTVSMRTSESLSTALGMVVSGSVGVLAASAELVVVGIEQSARGVSVVVKNVADASGEVVTLLIDGSAVASLVIGGGLQASATSAGYILMATGKAIAFIPNEIGLSLLHQSRYSR